MQPLELLLFGIVSALALALIGTLMRPYVQRRRRAEQRLGAARSGAGEPERASPGLTPAVSIAARRLCPTCHREFNAGERFCPFDGEELTGLATADRLPLPAMAHAHRAGKICPTCSQRYEPDATFCARDGAELVSVN